MAYYFKHFHHAGEWKHHLEQRHQRLQPAVLPGVYAVSGGRRV
jgi:hypothetical protein